MTPPEPASDTGAPRRPSPFRSFRHRDYTLLWLGMFMGSALMPMQFMTQVLFLGEHTGDSSRLALTGLLGASRGAAMLSVSLFGGALADRFDRRKLLMVTQSAGMILSAFVAVLMLTTPGGDPLTVSILLVLVFLASGLAAVDAPTRMAMVPELVGRQDLANAIALDAVAMQIAFPIGLPLSGVLMDSIGFGWTYVITLLAYVFLVGALALMRYRPQPRPRQQRSVVGDIREGIAYVRRHQAILWILVLSFSVMGIAFPVVTNLGLVWTSRVLDLSPTGVGLLAMTWGVGAMAASIGMTNVGHFERKGWLLIVAAAGFTLCVAGFGYSRFVPLSAVLNLGLGGLSTVQTVTAVSLIQRTVPNEVQGRVMSLSSMTNGVAQLLTLPIGGFAQWATFELTMPLAGWASLALVLLIAIARPEVRNSGRLAEVTDATISPVPAAAAEAP